MITTYGGGGLVLTPVTLHPASGEAGVFLMSDLHLGAANADYALINNELAAAKKRGDRVAINGDIFDMLLTKDTKRFQPSVLHPTLHGRDDIVNAAVDLAYETFAPYASIIDMIGLGNHETAVIRYHSLDPVMLLVQRLRQLDKCNTSYGGYQGFLRYYFSSLPRVVYNVFYWHGSGGGSALSGAMAEFSSKAAFVENADVVWFAHRHCRVATHVERISCSPNGKKLVKRQQLLLRTGGYLDSYSQQDDAINAGRKSNYSADALHTPYGKGGIRLVFTTTGNMRVELTT